MNFEAVVESLEKKDKVVDIGDFSGLMPNVHCESAVFISHFPHAISDF